MVEGLTGILCRSDPSSRNFRAGTKRYEFAAVAIAFLAIQDRAIYRATLSRTVAQAVAGVGWPADVAFGSWPCQNALPQRLGMRRGCDASFFFRL